MMTPHRFIVIMKKISDLESTLSEETDPSDETAADESGKDTSEETGVSGE